jgi:hypothetical protein
MQLLGRMIALTVGLFTENCSLAVQMKELHTELQEREQHIMGDPAAAADIIPQLTWAIIVGARDFFGTICTRNDVDPDNNEDSPQRPKLAVANLSIHTHMFRAGYKMQLATVPIQWLTKANPAQPKRQTEMSGSGRQSTQGTQDRRGSNPFQRNGDEGTGKGTNPNPPRAFANSAKLKELRNKFKGITLNEISREAGVREGASRLDTTGIPAKSCMTWICMGQCLRPQCNWNHPSTVEDTAAEALYKQIEPGITRILESGKRPKLGTRE